MMRWLGLTPLFCLLAACNVASVQEAPDTIARNECKRDADCAGGSCIAEQCQSTTTTFQSMLFQVTPPADGSDIAGLQFLIPKQDVGQSDAGGALELGQISHVVGKVLAKDRKCSPKFVGTSLTDDGGTVPARVSLIPTPSALGLSTPRVVVQAGIVNSSYWGFSANVVPGSYDIYVEPSPQPDESCPVPPQLTRGQRIDPGTPSLDIVLPEPSLFEFHATRPRSDGGLDGWTVDMLDPVSGRVISNRVPLSPVSGGNGDYVAHLSYAPVLLLPGAKAQEQDQLFRLSPPAGSADSAALPTVLAARSALALFEPGVGTLSKFGALPNVVHVHGQVTEGDSPNPVAATVTLVATKITGIQPGMFASFVRTVSAGEDGMFEVYLPPGKYNVSTLPRTPLEPSRKNLAPLAADTREWDVASTPEEQAGKVIGLGVATTITGVVLDAAENAVATAQVQAVASAKSTQADALQQYLSGAPLLPRASAGGVGMGGEFSLWTDPGTFDITVRPNTDTGFAWLVLPNVASGAGIALGRISMPLPVPYRGTVTTPGVGGPTVASALVRAFIYLKDNEYTADPSKADSVLQVAETRASNEGQFEILIPAELNRRP